MPFEIFIVPGLLCFGYAFYKAYRYHPLTQQKDNPDV